MSQIAIIYTEEGQVGYIETGKGDVDYYWEHWGASSKVKEFLIGLNDAKRKVTEINEDFPGYDYTETRAELDEDEINNKLLLYADQLKSLVEVWEVNVYARN